MRRLALEVCVIAALLGVIGGVAAATVRTTATVEVTVWKHIQTERIYLSTRPAGGEWTTHNRHIKLDPTEQATDGTWIQGSAVTVDVPITVATPDLVPPPVIESEPTAQTSGIQPTTITDGLDIGGAWDIGTITIAPTAATAAITVTAAPGSFFDRRNGANFQIIFDTNGDGGRSDGDLWLLVSKQPCSENYPRNSGHGRRCERVRRAGGMMGDGFWSVRLQPVGERGFLHAEAIDAPLVVATDRQGYGDRIDTLTFNVPMAWFGTQTHVGMHAFVQKLHGAVDRIPNDGAPWPTVRLR